MELESYYDGVGGLSGAGSRIAPMIAPGDSFVARFTPPRAGTFIYHSHSDEPRTHRAGLLGAMVVREGTRQQPIDEAVFFLKAARERGRHPIDINGQANPDTVRLRVGHTTRLRFIALTVVNPGARVSITTRADSAYQGLSDSLIVPMTLVAKDGADLPASARRVTTSRQVISMGETYDFEITPSTPGLMRMEVRGGNGVRVLARVPIVVR
jgi:FtsP/CotA-like multicopper oxidase with cupredoxin domain